MHKILFQEKQKFTQWWLWLGLLALLAAMVYMSTSSVTSNHTQGSASQVEPAEEFPQILNEVIIQSDFSLLWICLPMFAVCLLFLVLKLETSITENKLHIRYYPFLKKTINWQDVESAEVIAYGFVGGWGIRLGTQYGTVYNVKGNKGLFVKFKNGKKRLVGTQRPDELKKVVNKILS